MNRRTFLGQGLVMGGAALAAGAAPAAIPATQPAAATAADASAPPPWAPGPKSAWVGLVQTGWNLYSTRFVDAPTWTWKPVTGAAAYIVQFALATDRAARTVHLDAPTYDMAKDWSSLSPGCIDMIAWAVDAQDRAITVAWRKRFWKSRDFDGVRQDPLDYRASLHASLAYLLA